MAASVSGLRLFFAELFEVIFAFGLAFPPVIGGVFRALVTLQGTLEVLAPGFQLLDEARTAHGMRNEIFI